MATNVSEIVNSARFNWYHLRICLLCAMLVLVDGFDLSAISYAAGDFVKFLGVDRAVMGPVFSTGFFGLSFGALTFGLIGDRWGPKRTFILCGLIFGVFTLATAAATSLTMLLVLRAIAGWGLGGATPLSIAIASEYLPQRLRTSLVMVMYISLALGIMVGGYVFAYVTLFGWRTVFIVGGILPFLCSPFLYAYLPERLEFMVMKGFAPARIAAVLARVVPGRDFSRETGFTVDQENKPGFQLAQLFQERRAAITSVLWVVFFSSLLAVYFFNAWLPLLLASYGLSQPDVVKINSSLQLGGIAGTIVAATFVIALGGFRTVAAGYFVAALAIVALAMAPHTFGFLFVASLGLGFFLVGTQSVLNASCANLYPPAIRATGVGWGFGIGRTAAIVSPSVAGILLGLHWQPSDLFLLAAIPTLCASVSGLAVLLLVGRRQRVLAVAPAE
ncbi:MAG TPA: MFS transporter [Stellaceae bacterium]|nr:MFS transporter [Stellaceae bacterium]